jgi:cytochrome oxidase Cu insertion factor (SCO1/SenC/PrrC family)
MAESIRDWDKSCETARINGVFSEEEKRDCQDFRFCLIGWWNKRTGRELHREHPTVESMGYAFCAAVCHNEVEIAFHIKNAVRQFLKTVGIK